MQPKAHRRGYLALQNNPAGMTAHDKNETSFSLHEKKTSRVPGRQRGGWTGRTPHPRARPRLPPARMIWSMRECSRVQENVLECQRMFWKVSDGHEISTSRAPGRPRGGWAGRTPHPHANPRLPPARMIWSMRECSRVKENVLERYRMFWRVRTEHEIYAFLGSSSLGFKVQSSGFRVQSLGFRV